MKKIFLLVLSTFLIFSGCSKQEQNQLEVQWTLDAKLKPDIVFERSIKNESYGVFYVDTQIKWDEFMSYINHLASMNFQIDWRYSDTDSIEKLENEFKEQSSTDNIFKDGYVNVQMCLEQSEENEGLCFFMQWVDLENYNSLNPKNPVSYSFKLEAQKSNSQT